MQLIEILLGIIWSKIKIHLTQNLIWERNWKSITVNTYLWTQWPTGPSATKPTKTRLWNHSKLETKSAAHTKTVTDTTLLSKHTFTFPVTKDRVCARIFKQRLSRLTELLDYGQKVAISSFSTGSSCITSFKTKLLHIISSNTLHNRCLRWNAFIWHCVAERNQRQF